jgi:hypothetical protein
MMLPGMHGNSREHVVLLMAGCLPACLAGLACVAA